MRRVFVILLLALMPALAACGDGGTGPSEAQITGSYTLQTINGSNLPFTLVQIGADKLVITGGTVTLNADNTFSDRTTFRLTEGGSVSTETVTTVGTYSRNNNAIQFTSSDGETLSASISGNSLTQTQDDIVLVYKK